MNKRIYFDHAATTPLKKEVLDKMLPYLTEVYGNPSSLHYFGREAVKAVDEARDNVAKIINAKPSEIYFTSGGTEADNTALYGAMLSAKDKKHFIISSIEHPALLKTAEVLSKRGYEYSLCKVDKEGVIDLEDLKGKIRSDTAFVGIMYANNEIGTVEPIEKIVKTVKEINPEIICFTDAVQAAGSLTIDVKKLGVDMLSFSAHKFYGPKGVGALYVKSGTNFSPILTGGHQEREKRAGTQNVAGIVGLAAALEIANENKEKKNEYVKNLRDRFIKKVFEEIKGVKLNGSAGSRLPSNANFSFENVSGEALLYNLDLKNIAVSNGSACTAGTIEPSHVLLAIGESKESAKSAVRFTFGEENTVKEIDYAVKVLKETVDKLREITPLFKAETDIKKV